MCPRGTSMKVSKLEKKFGKAIARRRKRLRLTQLQTARKSKLRRSHYTALELGTQNVFLRHAVRICKALGLKLDRAVR